MKPDAMLTGPVDESLEFGHHNATVTYNEIIAYRWVRDMNRRIERVHPVPTKQSFDFRQNLFAHV